MEALSLFSREMAESRKETQRLMEKLLPQKPSSEAALARNDPPMYPKASDEEIAAAGGVLVDRASITVDVVPDNIRQKIANDDYVELAELVLRSPRFST